MPKWKRLLKYTGYKLMCEDPKSKNFFEVTHKLNGVPVDEIAKIVVKFVAKRFSTIASNIPEAFESIGCLYKEVNHIPRDRAGAVFLSCPETLLPPDRLAASVARVVSNLIDRLSVINIGLATEYSMREFVSPVLIELIILTAEIWKAMPGNENDSSQAVPCL